jgi:hypothetical protein
MRGRPKRYGVFAFSIAISAASAINVGCASYKVVTPDAAATGGSNGNAGAGAGGVTLNGSGGTSGDAATGGRGSGGTTGTGGATGSGGAAGSGGTSDGGVDRAGAHVLGESCVNNGDCASAHCAGAICCDQACAGPCAQCSSAGLCQMPADDPACGTITCAADTPCRDWATSITAARCKGIGQCKTATDCGYVNAPTKTFCGLYQGMANQAQVCDGQGTCGGPTVACGADGACGLNPGTCCFGAGTQCTRADQTCQRSATTLYGAVGCDEAADCPPSYLCCYAAQPAFIGTYCAPAPCPTATMYTWGQACNPGTPGECRSGTCQPTAAGPPYFLCQ